MFNRNLAILFASQLISVSGSVLIVTVGGIVGNQLASHPKLATLPLSLAIIGTALTAIPASLLMRAIGRRFGFALAVAVATGASLLAAYALTRGSFVLFCCATFLYGCNLAFTQQYRFAAAESVAPERVGRAISLVLLGAIGGAMLGPELAVRARHLIAGSDYAGSMLALAALLSVGVLLLLGLRDQPIAAPVQGERPARPLREIVVQPRYLVAVLAAMTGYGVMSFIMTATPMSMHLLDGHSMETTATVIRSHVIAMYLPSLMSGYLIEKIGVVRMMTIGAVLFLGTVAFGWLGHEFVHYWLALVALGIGWNFLYIGGTTLLTRTYYRNERFKAQGLNDFSVFGTAAVASLLAGAVIHTFGWNVLISVTVVPLLLVLAGLLGLELRRRRQRAPA